MAATTKQITVETTVNRPVEKVWECFTEPKHITQWAFASPDWHAPKATNDVRKGGKFSTTMAAKDGSASFDFEGVYDDVQAHKLIAYTMPDGRKVKTTFSQQGNATKVTQTFDPETENPVDMQRSGWQAILDNFRKHAESK
jgi:uncharacterized protein YndB with AHSA1/START domain